MGAGNDHPVRDRARARFRVSQGTVRKAITAMASENLLVRRQGKGTFVATHTEEKSSNFRFLRIRRNDGRHEYPVSRLIDLRRRKASAESAHALALKAGDAVFILRRTLEYGGRPAVLDENGGAVAAPRSASCAPHDGLAAGVSNGGGGVQARGGGAVWVRRRREHRGSRGAGTRP